jgi:Uma2 family endonuclease
MTDTPVQLRLSVDEFVRLYEDDGPFELIRGERIKRMPSVAGHNHIANMLLRALIAFLAKNPLGEAFIEAAFVLPDADDKQWVTGSRTPDVSFYSAARLDEYRAQNPDWKAKPYFLPPDLAVEIVSPNDTYSKVTDKVDLYLEDGVRLVWVIDPQRSKVTVYTADEQTTLGEDDSLSGGEALPGFEITIRTLFE